MFTDRSGLGLLPTCKDWRVVLVSLEPHGLRTVEGNLGDFLKENLEAIPEGGLADPSTEKNSRCLLRERSLGRRRKWLRWLVFRQTPGVLLPVSCSSNLFGSRFYWA